MVQRVLEMNPPSRTTGAAAGDMGLLHRVPDDDAVLTGFSDYLLLELNRSDQTVRGYSQQLKAVGKLLGKAIVEVSVPDVRHRVKRDSSVARSTRQLRIASFKKLHRWGLLEEERWADPAMLAVESIPEPRRMAKPPISLLDARKLLAHCETPNQYRVVYLPLFAGTRVGESAIIDRGSLVGESMTFIGKGNKERSVPVHPDLRKVLPLFLDTKPASKAVLTGVFTKMRDRLEIRDLKGNPATTHSLRRTFANFLYDTLRIEDEVVGAILGHAGSVTRLYAPVQLGRMKEAVYPVDYSLGEPVQLSLWA